MMKLIPDHGYERIESRQRFVGGGDYDLDF